MATITYEMLMAEINNLVAQIEQSPVENELIHVIQDVQEKVKTYNLTAVDLGLAEMIIRTRRKPEIKFRDPNTGANWTGRGKLPNWIKNSGKAKEEFLVN